MKANYKKCLCYLNVLLFSCSLNIPTSHEKLKGSNSDISLMQESTTSFSNYLETYFYHLDFITPKNVFNNCRAITIANTLMYFDTYYQDNIVTNEYEYPGNLLSSQTTLLNNTHSPVYNFKNTYSVSSSDFDKYIAYVLGDTENTIYKDLINIGIEKGYFVTAIKNNNIIIQNEKELAVSNEKFYEIFSTYLSRNSFFDKGYNYIKKTSGDFLVS